MSLCAGRVPLIVVRSDEESPDHSQNTTANENMPSSIEHLSSVSVAAVASVVGEEEEGGGACPHNHDRNHPATGGTVAAFAAAAPAEDQAGRPLPAIPTMNSMPAPKNHPSFKNNDPHINVATGGGVAPAASFNKNKNESIIGTTTTMKTGPNFKDQARGNDDDDDGVAARTAPVVVADLAPARLGSVPLAEARPVTDSQIHQEERGRWEQRNLQLQSELDRQRAENIRQQQDRQTQERQQHLPQPITNGSLHLSKQQFIGIGASVVVLVLALSAVAGVCGAGHCNGTRGSDDNRPSVEPSSSRTTPTPTPTTPTPTTPTTVMTNTTTLTPSTPPAPTTALAPPTSSLSPPVNQSTRSQSIVEYINSITLTGRILVYPDIYRHDP
jgi:hypothetical protein